MPNHQSYSTRTNSQILALLKGVDTRASTNPLNVIHPSQDSGYCEVDSAEAAEDESRPPTPCVTLGQANINMADPRLEPSKKQFLMDYAAAQTLFAPSKEESELLGKKSGWAWAMPFNNPMSQPFMGRREQKEKETNHHHVDVKGKGKAIDNSSETKERERALYALISKQVAGFVSPSAPSAVADHRKSSLYGGGSFCEPQAASLDNFDVQTGPGYGNGFAASSALTVLHGNQVAPSRQPLLEVLSQRVGTTREFMPSRAFEATPPNQLLLAQTPHNGNIPGYNPNYKGQWTRASNQDPTVPSELNTAVWVTNIPTNATMSDVLDAIRNCGRIFQCHLNSPTEHHETQAAKIVFTKLRGARAFKEFAYSRDGVRVLGKRLSVWPNRNSYREHPFQDQSRVLEIEGPERYVNCEFLSQYFGMLFRSDILDVWQGTVDWNGYTSMTWVFGSIHAQAANAKLAIECEPALKDLIKVTYGRDPCE